MRRDGEGGRKGEREGVRRGRNRGDPGREGEGGCSGKQGEAGASEMRWARYRSGRRDSAQALGRNRHLEIAVDQPDLVDVLDGVQDIDHGRRGILGCGGWDGQAHSNAAVCRAGNSPVVRSWGSGLSLWVGITFSENRSMARTRSSTVPPVTLLEHKKLLPGIRH